MKFRFDMQRRALRAELHKRRTASRDNRVERLMADGHTLDRILGKEFGTIERESGWCFLGNGGVKVAETEAKRLKALGVYDNLGGVMK